MYSRRCFLSTLSSCTRISSTSQQNLDTIEIGLYVTETGRNKYGSTPVNELSRVIESIFDRTFPRHETYIGPESVVTVPSHARYSAKSALNWWKHSGDYDHSNLLIFSREEVSWSDFAGYAYYNTPNAVVSGLSVMPVLDAYQHLAAHEIGHNFGLKHRHATTRDNRHTIMSPKLWEDNAELALEFSERSKEIIRRQLEN